METTPHVDNKYMYRQLKSEALTCRTVELLPGRYDHDIHINIAETQLAAGETKNFEAISYTWGARDYPGKVYVVPSRGEGDDMEPSAIGAAYLLATRSLCEALRHLRHTDAPRLLWVDAICINQEDTQERSEQVQLMPLIYRAAEHVTIWLGPEADDSAYAFSTLRMWASKTEYDYQNRAVVLKSSDSADAWMARFTTGVAYKGRDFVSCLALVKRPWFERTWIRQEVYLSRDKATVRCGYQAISWLDFHAALSSFISRRPDGAMPANETVANKQIWNRFDDLGGPQQLSFRSLIVRGRKSKCSDPRDKVYAVLGMLLRARDEWIAEAFRPDYTLSIRDLYKKVFAVLSRRERRLNLLAQCDPPPGSTWRPTWVPDWSTPNHSAFQIHRQYADLGMYTAAITICSDMLSVRGVVGAEVTNIFDWGLTPEECLSRNGPTLNEELKRLYSWCLANNPQFDRCSLLEAITYTLCQDDVKDHSERPSGKNYRGSTVADIKAVLYSIVEGDKVRNQLPDEIALDAMGSIMSGSLDYYCNRSLAITGNGRIALVPRHTEPGDVLAVLIGLSNVVILRPKDGEKFEFIGTCWAHGSNWGEALVGPLPDGWRFVRWYDDDVDGWWRFGFKHDATGALTVFDPRIEWKELALGESDLDRVDTFAEEGKGNYKSPDEAYLLRHGVQLRTLHLL